MTANGKEAVLGSFYGDDTFPVEWGDGERDLFWIFDDLHIPNPVSPMFFDIGGWWLTCDHMFRRFGTPFASDWIAKNVNGYVYHAAVPADPTLTVESSEYQARYAARVPRGEWAGGIGAYLGAVLPHYAENFLDWWRDRLRPEMEDTGCHHERENEQHVVDGEDAEHAAYEKRRPVVADQAGVEQDPRDQES